MCQRSRLGSPSTIHSAIDFADPARAGEPVGAEAGADEEAADLALAEAELVVGGEGLGAVDQLGHRDLVHRRHPALGVLGDLLEAVPVLFQQAAVEVGAGSRSTPAGAVGQEGRLAVALVAAHHQAVAVLAVVDEQVGVAQGGQVPRALAAASPRRAPRATASSGWVTRYWWDIGISGTRTPAMPADLGREHAAGVDHDLGRDRRRGRCARRARGRRGPRSRSPGSR